MHNTTNTTNTTYVPIALDVLITDVKSNDLHEKVSELLYKKYLSNTMKESDDVKGILFGEFQRPLCSMTLEIKGRVKNVHFLVDTGSPRTFVCEEALNSYKLFVTDPKAPFLAQLFVDFDEKYFTIKFKTSQTEVALIDVDNQVNLVTSYYILLVIIAFILSKWLEKQYYR
ncbi:hypothetical protein GLOIN_2v1474342 [Rhizophagus clarus]|uniref:Uncharacterized protein n=2 Tax=Rhizophagus clarus TaxID=94130 RepID=A0A8H3LWN1_9GLOM|nr:hypothetical protein GLOIN_2v1474342 [Rhizophagus clarus]